MTRRVDPVGAGDAIRARVPDVLRTYRATRANVLEGGRLDPRLKELCARFLAGYPEGSGVDVPEARDERERAALDWAQAIAWDPSLADDDLWERLHANFTEPELVELGYYIAIVHGQLHWLRTLGIQPPREQLIAP
jgi:alkylhydroperoxidase family enzyme